MEAKWKCTGLCPRLELVYRGSVNILLLLPPSPWSLARCRAVLSGGRWLHRAALGFGPSPGPGSHHSTPLASALQGSGPNNCTVQTAICCPKALLRHKLWRTRTSLAFKFTNRFLASSWCELGEEGTGHCCSRLHFIIPVSSDADGYDQKCCPQHLKTSQPKEHH